MASPEIPLVIPDWRQDSAITRARARIAEIQSRIPALESEVAWLELEYDVSLSRIGEIEREELAGRRPRGSVEWASTRAASARHAWVTARFALRSSRLDLRDATLELERSTRSAQVAVHAALEIAYRNAVLHLDAALEAAARANATVEICADAVHAQFPLNDPSGLSSIDNYRKIAWPELSLRDRFGRPASSRLVEWRTEMTLLGWLPAAPDQP
jgi:hypothetical protein